MVGKKEALYSIFHERSNTTEFQEKNNYTNTSHLRLLTKQNLLQCIVQLVGSSLSNRDTRENATVSHEKNIF